MKCIELIKLLKSKRVHFSDILLSKTRKSCVVSLTSGSMKSRMDVVDLTDNKHESTSLKMTKTRLIELLENGDLNEVVADESPAPSLGVLGEGYHIEMGVYRRSVASDLIAVNKHQDVQSEKIARGVLLEFTGNDLNLISVYEDSILTFNYKIDFGGDVSYFIGVDQLPYIINFLKIQETFEFVIGNQSLKMVGGDGSEIYLEKESPTGVRLDLMLPKEFLVTAVVNAGHLLKALEIYKAMRNKRVLFHVKTDQLQMESRSGFQLRADAHSDADDFVCAFDAKRLHKNLSQFPCREFHMHFSGSENLMMVRFGHQVYYQMPLPLR